MRDFVIQIPILSKYFDCHQYSPNNQSNNLASALHLKKRAIPIKDQIVNDNIVS